MRGNRYAAGALALSAGLSIYTASSLPRGGVAQSWATSEASLGARLSVSARAQAQRAASALRQLPRFSLSLPKRPQAAAPVAPPPAGAFFARRPSAASSKRLPLVSRRNDSLALVRAGSGATRVMGGADAYEGASTGGLEGFRWQDGPTARAARSAAASE